MYFTILLSIGSVLLCILSCLGNGGCECMILFLSSIENTPFLSMKRQELETLRGPQKLSQIQTSPSPSHKGMFSHKEKEETPKKAHIFIFLRVDYVQHMEVAINAAKKIVLHELRKADYVQHMEVVIIKRSVV
uniref:Uncharacterized protein n=1 Tax=Timema bartmani TaxID=61472 RepID=A0A7R9EZT9_9NEOP|nr:unnamed protein product [Timema bartmani]